MSALDTGDSTDLAGPGALTLRRLASLLASYAAHDGIFPLRLPGTYAIRLSRMTTEASYSTLGPAVCVAAQGAKAIMLARDVIEYDPRHLLVFALDLPDRFVVTFKGRNLDLPRRYRTTNVWVKRDGRWQIVAAHMGFVLDQQQAALLERSGRAQ